MNVVVFVGPTLDLPTARAHLPNAVFLPPAGQLDLLSAARRFDAHVIGLIDGYFRQQMAVWHKEILAVLADGVHVYGASSMGALRAAELAPFGMVGVGDVYDLYASGRIDRDDEVALVHGSEDAGFRPLSEPLVNIRATVSDAVATGVITAEAERIVVGAGSAMPYPERTLNSVIAAAEREGLDPLAGTALRGFAEAHRRDVKREDALLLLDTMAGLDDGLAPFEPDFTLERPHVLQAALDRDVMFDHGAETVTAAEVAYHEALHRPDFTTFNFNLLNRLVVAELCEMLELDVDPAAATREARRHRLALGLVDDGDFDRWLADNDLDAAEYDGLMLETARCRRLQQWMITRRNNRGTARAIVDALRLEGRYPDAAAETAQQKSLVEGDVYRHTARRLDAEELSDMVLQHLRATPCRMDVDYRQWMWEAGFPDESALAVELERSRRAREAIVERLSQVLSDLPETT